MKLLTDAQKESILYILAGVCFLLPEIQAIPYLVRFTQETWYHNYYHWFWLLRYSLPVVGCALLAVGAFLKRPFPLAAVGYALLAAAQVNLFIACWIVGMNIPVFGASNALELAGCVCAGILIVSRRSPRNAGPRWVRDDWYVPVVLLCVAGGLYTIVRTPRLMRSVLIYGEMRRELDLEETLLQFCWRNLIGAALLLLLPLGSFCLLRPPKGQAQ